jgi:hypothetical protein
VRAQFADLDHHIRANVHPKLRFEVHARGHHDPLPLPPVIDALVKPLLQAQIRKEVSASVLEDRADIERGYPPRSAAALAAA